MPTLPVGQSVPVPNTLPFQLRPGRKGVFSDAGKGSTLSEGGKGVERVDTVAEVAEPVIDLVKELIEKMLTRLFGREKGRREKKEEYLPGSKDLRWRSGWA